MRGSTGARTIRARSLRRLQTDAERKLWYRLNNGQLAGRKFVRQEPVGPYFVDFCCREARLVVEVDGSQHAGSARDQVRDAALAARGYRVLRFCNHDVLTTISSVLDTILATLETPLPATAKTPLPAMRGEGRVGGSADATSAAQRSEGEGGFQDVALTSRPPSPSPFRPPSPAGAQAKASPRLAGRGVSRGGAS